jgi:hypothetical protein
VAQRVGRGIALRFHDHNTRRGEWSASRPGRTLPPGKTGYPLYRRLGGPQGQSGQVRKISPPPVFDPRTVQPVAQSLYRLSYRAREINEYQEYVLWSKCGQCEGLAIVPPSCADCLEIWKPQGQYSTVQGWLYLDPSVATKSADNRPLNSFTYTGRL